MSDYKANKNYAEIMRGGADLARDQRDEEMQDRIEKERKAIAALPDLIEALEHALADLKALGGRTLLVEAALKKAGVE